jgi:hypothetical protein
MRIVFPFIIWFYGSAIVIIRGWGCGFGNSEDIVTWLDNRPSFTILEFMAVVAIYLHTEFSTFRKEMH